MGTYSSVHERAEVSHSPNYPLTYTCTIDSKHAHPFRVQKSYSYFSTKSTTTYGQVFGLPIVVTVPRGGCTYRQLYSTILDQTKRYVSVPAKNEEVEQDNEEDLNDALSEGGYEMQIHIELDFLIHVHLHVLIFM